MHLTPSPSAMGLFTFKNEPPSSRPVGRPTTIICCYPLLSVRIRSGGNRLFPLLSRATTASRQAVFRLYRMMPACTPVMSRSSSYTSPRGPGATASRACSSDRSAAVNSNDSEANVAGR